MTRIVVATLLGAWSAFATPAAEAGGLRSRGRAVSCCQVFDPCCTPIQTCVPMCVPTTGGSTSPRTVSEILQDIQNRVTRIEGQVGADAVLAIQQKLDQIGAK